MAMKRVFNLSTGDTPGKPKDKKPVFQPNSRRTLFSTEEKCSKNTLNAKQEKPIPWSEQETKALVQYVCLFWKDAWSDKWPSTKDENFWEECAEAINKTCSSSRTGVSCRTRVLKHMTKKYPTLSDAEEAFDIDYIVHEDENVSGKSPITPSNTMVINDNLSPIFKTTSLETSSLSSRSVGGIVQEFITTFMHTMSHRLKKQLVHYLYKLLVIELGGMPLYQFVQEDFLDVSLSAMNTLFKENKKNLVYSLSRCFERRGTELDTRMPLHRMPFGLIDYNLRFFSANNTQKIGIEDHYVQWLETMFAHFGHKWMCLHRGPVWQYEVKVETDDQSNEGESKVSDILQDALEFSGISSLSFDIESINLEPQTGNAQVQHVLSVDEGEEIICDSQIETSINFFSDDIEDFTCVPQAENTQEIFNSAADDTEKVTLLDCSIYESQNVVPCVSHLWTGARCTSELETPLTQPDPRAMEQHHGIRQDISKKKYENPWKYNPLKSKVNVASLGPRSIQRHLSNSKFNRTANVQIEALRQAKKSNQDGRWWIKADACDVRSGLRESMRGEWAGDEDLGSGAVQLLHKEYRSRCQSVRQLGVIVQKLVELTSDMENDLVFLVEGEKMAKKEYAKAIEISGKRESTLMELAWNVTGFERLIEQGNGFINELKNFMEQIKMGESKKVTESLHCFKTSALQYLRELYTKKRSPASHLLIFMISDESRNKKPYANPVRFLPYHSLTDAKLRDLELEVESDMKSLGMNVVGFSTDGEFNSLRTNGKKRPISAIEIAKIAKKAAKSVKAADVSKLFTLDIHDKPIKHHDAVPLADVQWLDNVMKSNCGQPISFHDASLMLRKKLFPPPYDPHPWVTGRAETTVEILRSILAIYEFRLQVGKLKNNLEDPADFAKFLYQPEFDRDTGEYIHHREDHNHLLKRIISSLREGLIPGIDLRYFRDALNDGTTGLTYEALTGKNKQSVPDCERIISTGVISFLERKGDKTGAEVIKRLHNWHKAVDGRGLSENARSAYCEAMKFWLLDEWIPWHRQNPDYSLLDVNRPVKGICGLTREVVIGLVANLESRSLRRVENVQRGLQPEHPRSSSTDDVEGFISLLHEMLGPIFDIKQFNSQQPKILNEFRKRIDGDLGFFYWTGAKTRYNDAELPSFNEPSGPGVKERLDQVQVSRRGDPGVFVANRASLPQRGQLTARAQFHRAPVALPPLPLT